MENMTAREPRGRHQSKKAAASGWIGSALEYYDFFIYATAASLIFPQIFFPSANPTVSHRRVSRDLWCGLRCAARSGRSSWGIWGDTHGRKNVLLVCMFLMGFSTMAVGLVPTYQSNRRAGAGACWSFLRLIQGFAVAGEISGASSMILEHAPFGRRGFFASFSLQGVQAGQILAAAVFLPLAHFMDRRTPSSAWGWRVPFLLSALVVIIAGYIIRREVEETPGFRRRSHGRSSAVLTHRPGVQAQPRRHVPRRLHVADECHSRGRHGLRRCLCGAARLWHRLRQGRLSVDPRGRQHPGGAGHPPSSATCPTGLAAARR